VLGFQETGVAGDVYWIVALLCGYLAVVWWYRWLHITEAGRTALAAEMAALRALLDRHDNH
jgi:hypothetical protein